MNLFQIISVIILTISIGYSNDESTNIDTLKNECNNNHDVKSCYMAGQYYMKESETNSSFLTNALIYYDAGCAHYYDAGFFTRDVKFKSDKKSCLEEAKILKDKKQLTRADGLDAALKLKKTAEYYYKQNDFTQTIEYYLASLSWFKDAEIYYILSQMALNGEGTKVDYTLSKHYYFQYLQNSIGLNMRKLRRLVRSRLNVSSLRVESEMTLLADGTIGSVSLKRASKDNVINQTIIEKIKKRTYHPIPAEYSIGNINIPVNYIIK